MRPSTIGLLTTSYPCHEHDVAGLFVRGFARALANRGHRVEVLAPEPHEGGAPPADAGITVEWVPYLRPRWLERTFYGAGVPDNVKRDPRAWPGLATYPWALHQAAQARVSGWDAIVSHWALPCALVAGRIRGARPHLAVLHSADVFLLGRLPLRRRWALGIAEGASHLLFSSAALRRQWLSWLPPLARAEAAGRAHVSAMGIDMPPPVPRRTARRATGASKLTLLVVARLVTIKGVDVAIEALAPLREAGIELWIAGDGPRREALESLARRRGVEARFFGVVTGARKAELFAAADVFLAPSLNASSGRTEGTPTAVLEAASSGLPIVASAVGGIEDVLTHERNALLVPPADPVALRQAIERLRLDPALRRRLGRAARTVGRRYGWSELAPHIEALLEP
jgi:glycosyltransferase involved in cell wall biosynthesis